MKVTIRPGRVKGEVTAPSSKSYTIRGLMCAALARGTSQLQHPLDSDDTAAASRVLKQIGVDTSLHGDSWRITEDGFTTPSHALYCGDSAATFRFMTAVGCLVPGGCRLSAGPSLSKRPVKILVDALRLWGVDISSDGDYAPVTVREGLMGGNTVIAGNISSQFVSALLMVAPFCQIKSRIHLTSSLESLPYVEMTLECLEKFGIIVQHSDDLREYEIKPQRFAPATYGVEGDWSSASYLLSLGAVSGQTVVSNLNTASLQGDRVILHILKDMGAVVNQSQKGIVIEKNHLIAINTDLSNCIDLLPTVAVLAALAEGTSELRGIKRARIKESNRVASMREGLEKVGIQTREEDDKLVISGGKCRSAVIDCKNDHRIAMAFSLIGAGATEITLQGAECISKTFPQYWQLLRQLGVDLDEQ